MAKQRHQIALEASAHLLAELMHLAAESLKHHLGFARGRGVRALDLGPLAHDGVVTDLLLLGLRQRPVAAQLLQGQLLLQVDEDAHAAQATRVAALDGHEQLLQRLAGRDVFDGGRVLGQLRQPLGPGQVHIGGDEPGDGVECLFTVVADLADGFHGLQSRGRANAVRAGQGERRGLQARLVRGQLRRVDGPGFRPTEGGLDRLGQQVAGGGPLDHRRGHAVNAAGGATGRADGGGLDRGQTGVDALDGCVGLVGINGDDEFEAIFRGQWMMFSARLEICPRLPTPLRPPPL